MKARVVSLEIKVVLRTVLVLIHLIQDAILVRKASLEMEAVLRENLVLYREAQLEMRAVLQSFLVLNRMASLVMKVVLEAVLVTTRVSNSCIENSFCLRQSGTIGDGSCKGRES